MTSTVQTLSDLEPSFVSRRTYATRRRSPRIDAATILGLMIVLLTVIPSRYILPGLTDLGRPGLVVGFLLFCWWVMVRFAPHLVVVGPQPLRWALLAFGITCLISYAAGELRGLTTMEFNGADRMMLFVGVFMGVALAVADGIPNWWRLQVVVKVLVWFGTFMATVGIIQYVTRIDVTAYLAIPGLEQKGDQLGFESRGAGVRVASTATHYIELATILATILPFAIHQTIFATSRKAKFWYGVCSLALTLCTLATISRTGMLGLFIVLFVLVPTWGWRLRYNVLVISGMFLAVLTAAKPSLAVTLFRLFDDPTNNPAFTVREDRYPLVWYYVGQRPWFGRGTGTYIAPQYQILDNWWLSFLISNGIIGVAVLAALHFTGVTLAFKAMRRAASPEIRHLCAVVLSTQLIAIVVAFTYDSLAFLSYATIVGLTLGMCAAVWRLTHPARIVRTTSAQWFRGVEGQLLYGRH